MYDGTESHDDNTERFHWRIFCNQMLFIHERGCSFGIDTKYYNSTDLIILQRLSLTKYQERCAKSRYEGRGQVITSHSMCSM